MAITTMADGGSATTSAATGTGNISLMASGDSSPVAVTSPGGANTAITGTGATSTSSVDCPGCCGPYYLPNLFGAPTGGLCPGAVSNTTPVTLTATVTITPASGISLATYCLPSSASFDVVTSNPLLPNALYLADAVQACTSTTPPTTRFYPDSNPTTGNWVFNAPGGYYLAVQLAACDCTTSRAVRFIGSFGSGSLIRGAYDCSVPSITYGQGEVYSGGTYLGSWKVTLTP